MTKLEHLDAVIGNFIRNCGCLEFMLNRIIGHLSQDPILAEHVMRMGFVHKADLLESLVADRHQRHSVSDIRALTTSIKDLAVCHHDIAHNPIVTDEDNQQFSVMCIKTKNKHEMLQEYTCNVIKQCAEQANDVIETLKTLLPSTE